MLYNKRGELTTAMIVTLSVLILSTIIIIVLLVRMDLGGTADTQLCHNSVVQRGSTALSTDAVPLNCRTHYVCISATSKCSDSRMPAPDDVIKVQTEEEVYRALAEEMANCWWTYGEGKVDYVGADLTKNLYCSVCSNVVFDKSVSAKIGSQKINQDGLNKYLTSNIMSNSEKTYAEYFYNQPIPKGTSLEVKDDRTSFDYLSLEFDLNKAFYIVTARSSAGTWVETAIGTVAGVGVGVAVAAVAVAGVTVTALSFGTAGTVAIPGAALIISALVTGGVAGGAAGGYGGHVAGIFIESEGNKILLPMFIDQDDFKGIPCEDVNTLS